MRITSVKIMNNNYSPSLEGKYSEHGSGRRGAPCFDGLCLYICHLITDWGLVRIRGARISELRRAMWVYLGGAERHASEGYVGISAAGGSGGLVRSSGAWSAEL